MSAAGSSYFGGNKSVYGAGILLSVPVFDGFARREKLRIAEAELQASEDELDSLEGLGHARGLEGSDTGGDGSSETGFRREAHRRFRKRIRRVARILQTRAGTYVEVSNAQRSVASARSVMVDTRSAVHTSITNLALTVGDLARPAPDHGAQP